MPERARTGSLRPTASPTNSPGWDTRIGRQTHDSIEDNASLTPQRWRPIRLFDTDDGWRTIHYVVLPWWLLTLAFAVMPVVRWRSWRKARTHQSAGRCPNCGYDLRATPDRCPECGRPADAASG